ncbi:hypothetical protein AL052_21070 [Pseudomonas amygdali pv. eriobotryae]|nr:hypothetical protein AL052_21070 [Pseudomonas amygdali pv. eriobotryae]
MVLGYGCALSSLRWSLVYFIFRLLLLLFSTQVLCLIHIFLHLLLLVLKLPQAGALLIFLISSLTYGLAVTRLMFKVQDHVIQELHITVQQVHVTILSYRSVQTPKELLKRIIVGISLLIPLYRLH